jgi:hypothetical protein
MRPSRPSLRPSRSARLAATAAFLAQFACGRQDVELATWIGAVPGMEDGGSTAPRGSTPAVDAAVSPSPPPEPCVVPVPVSAPACVVEGASCESDAECCSLRCDGEGKAGQCKEPHGECRPAGESCAPGPGACCGRCDAATLRCAPTACALAGAECGHDADCCDGACNADGTCAPPATKPCVPATPAGVHTR